MISKLAIGYTSANHIKISVTTLSTITPLLSVFYQSGHVGRTSSSGNNNARAQKLLSIRHSKLIHHRLWIQTDLNHSFIIVY